MVRRGRAARMAVGGGATARLILLCGVLAGLFLMHGSPAAARCSPFHAELAKPGDWRLFLQFQTGGSLHTAALTLRVG